MTAFVVDSIVVIVVDSIVVDSIVVIVSIVVSIVIVSIVIVNDGTLHSSSSTNPSRTILLRERVHLLFYFIPFHSFHSFLSLHTANYLHHHTHGQCLLF